MIQTSIIEMLNFDINEIKTNYENQLNSGNLFLIIENNRENENIFSIIEKTTEIGYFFWNNIICITNENKKIDNSLKNSYYNLLWFVKNPEENKFNKDTIREKHIWKDIEWGKRSKNYNLKGKDPGNVWIPTEDDGKGRITKHIILDFEEVINRILLSTSETDDEIYIKINKILDTNLLIKNRKIKIEKDVKNTKSKRMKIKKMIKLVKNENNKSKKKADVYFKTSEKMQEISDKEIDLIVTSPPYWDLKNYFKKGQIGQETYEKYLERLKTVWKECFRILKSDGNMFINVNTRTKNKKPILIPGDIIKQCNNIGFFLKDIIIWHKSSGIPTSNKNLTDRYEYILWFEKKYERKISKKMLKQINDYKNEKLNYGNIWNINRKAGSIGKDYIHPAIYPNKLVKRIIELVTNEGDIVFDPFLGSGTTLIEAISSNRYFKGYEYNDGFYNLIHYRILQELSEINFDLRYHNLKQVKDFEVYRKTKKI